MPDNHGFPTAEELAYEEAERVRPSARELLDEWYGTAGELRAERAVVQTDRLRSAASARREDLPGEAARRGRELAKALTPAAPPEGVRRRGHADPGR